MSNSLIKSGLLKSKRRRMVAEGASPEALAAIDKQLADLEKPPSAAKVAQDATIRSLIGDGFDHLDGPEMTELRKRICAAEERVDPVAPSGSRAKIVAGLKARQSKGRDDTHIPNWETEASLRRK